ncbi:hypothetical protein HKD37_06G017175 [Glycine soja]
MLFFNKHMTTSPNSPPSSPESATPSSPSTSLATRSAGMERPVIHVDPLTLKADGPQRKKLRTCLGIVTCDKVDVTCNNWKQFPVTQKDMIWEDIQKQFKSDLTSKWALAHDKEGEDDKVCEKYGISKEKLNQFCQSHKDPSWELLLCVIVTGCSKQGTYHSETKHLPSHKKKLMEEKQKKRLEEAAQSGSIDTLVDHPSPIRWHMKWNMARTKKTGQITYEATKEIADKIDSLEKQASQGSFVAHGRQDVLTTAIGQPEHPGCVRAVRAGVMIKNYFGPASRDSCISSSMAVEDLGIMASPLGSSPPPPPLSDASASPPAVKRTRKATCLRSLSIRPPSAKRPVVHVDPATDKVDGPHRKKLRTYLGVVARDKVDVTYENWKEVPTTQKDLIWEDIQKLKSQRLLTVGRKRSYLRLSARDRGNLNQTSRGNGPFVDDTVCEKYDISKEKWTRKDPSWEICEKRYRPSRNRTLPPHVLSRGGYEYLKQKLLDEKMKKKLKEAAKLGSVDGVIDPPSPVRRHVKCKMTRTKKTGEMTTEAAKEITDKIQLTQQIRDQLEESITEKVTHQLMASFNQMQSQFQSQMQSQGLALPPEPLVGPSGPRVSTKESYVDPSRNDPETGDSERCGLYIEANSDCLVALGRVYEGSTVVHNTRLLPGKVKVSVEEVKDSDAPVLYPLMSGAGNSHFLCLADTSGQAFITAVVSLAKPPEKPDLEVDDPLYLMTLTIPELFLRPYQVTWDAAVFKVFNPDFLLYIKHEDLFEIAHGGQCLSISVLDNYLKGIINSALKGLDDAPHPKSKAPTRWIVVKYFNDPRPLEPKRLKALRIQWTQYYLQVQFWVYCKNINSLYITSVIYKTDVSTFMLTSVFQNRC